MHRERIDYVPDIAPRLAAAAARPWFIFLDSCAGRSVGGRFDIITAEPRVTITTHGDTSEVREIDRVTTTARDPFALVSDAIAGCDGELGDLPFAGGAAGYFAYDLARRIETLPLRARHDISIPDMAIGIYDWAAVFDHHEHCAWLVASDRCAADLGYWQNLLTTPDPVTPAAYATTFEVTSSVKPDIEFSAYANAFARIKHYITEGDCYQVNLAQRFSAEVSGDSWDAYLRLRQLNPAPYSAFMKLPEGAILSSSPERFLKVRDGAVETKPIKGTRPRSSNPAHDRRLREELATSAKDQAENVMIVDLLRNDLGKSCATGSVEVPELFAIESFAKVHHLVSTVRGRLARGVSPLALLRGCFPGGSITGAPKLRAMEIIEELEPARRTVYCGAIGYVGYDGSMDTNIAIRTLVHAGSRMYCWAGGGIVADSNVEAEFDESLDKARAMLDVLRHAESAYLDR